MTFRGIYRDGVIIPSRDPDLPDGTPVRCTPAPSTRRTASTKKRTPTSLAPKKRKPKAAGQKRMTKAQRIAAFMQGVGMYQDRPDWKGRSTIEIATELRRKALGGRFGA